MVVEEKINIHRGPQAGAEVLVRFDPGSDLRHKTFVTQSVFTHSSLLLAEASLDVMFV